MYQRTSRPGSNIFLHALAGGGWDGFNFRTPCSSPSPFSLMPFQDAASQEPTKGVRYLGTFLASRDGEESGTEEKPMSYSVSKSMFKVRKEGNWGFSLFRLWMVLLLPKPNVLFLSICQTSGRSVYSFSFAFPLCFPV